MTKKEGILRITELAAATFFGAEIVRTINRGNRTGSLMFNKEDGSFLLDLIKHDLKSTARLAGQILPTGVDVSLDAMTDSELAETEELFNTLDSQRQNTLQTD